MTCHMRGGKKTRRQRGKKQQKGGSGEGVGASPGTVATAAPTQQPVAAAQAPVADDKNQSWLEGLFGGPKKGGKRNKTHRKKKC